MGDCERPSRAGTQTTLPGCFLAVEEHQMEDWIGGTVRMEVSLCISRMSRDAARVFFVLFAQWRIPILIGGFREGLAFHGAIAINER